MNFLFNEYVPFDRQVSIYSTPCVYVFKRFKRFGKYNQIKTKQNNKKREQYRFCIDYERKQKREAQTEISRNLD